MRRLAEIEANLLRSPLDRLETHEHRTERRRLRDEIYGPVKRGGDRRSERFQNERGFALKSSILSVRRDREHRNGETLDVSRNPLLQASFGGGAQSAQGHVGGELRQRPVRHRRHWRHPEKDGGALSDAEKPAPSLHEAKCRAGLAPPLEPDLEKEADQEVDQEAHLLFRALFDARHDALERFLREVADRAQLRRYHDRCGQAPQGTKIVTPPLPEPLMLNGEPHYTARQIAEMRLPGLSGTRRGVNVRVLSESCPYSLRPSGRGGGKVYPLKALPDEAQAKIRRPARPKPTQPAPADSASTQKKPNEKKRLFLDLGPDQREMLEAKAEAVCLWRYYKKRVFWAMSIGDALEAFCFLWKAGQAGAEDWAWKALPMRGVRSLYRWDKAPEKGGLNALVGQRGQAQAGRSILETYTEMREALLGILAAYPHANATHLAQGLAVRFPSCPHRLPGVRTIRRWTKKWKEENRLLWAHLSGSDAARGLHALSADFSKDISMEKGRES